MGTLQDMNEYCPTKKASTIAAWDCCVRAEAGRCIYEDIGLIYRMKMLRGEKS